MTIKDFLEFLDINVPEKRILNRNSVYLQYDKGYNHCFGDFEQDVLNQDIPALVAISIKNSYGPKNKFKTTEAQR